ncbi:hypothetical protein [uncultured Victivallis sp.]|uniref:hypothetical protein n=1 Tax=uncultured Victivallis sp. TaxID=354118 RepID=UPI0025E5D735|nr:hypothetical protein [uncultured Victivallis sp.]
MDQRKTADFVDELMMRAFSLPAPEMPDFASIPREESSLLELKDEELDFLAAAGMSRREELQRKHEKGGH